MKRYRLIFLLFLIVTISSCSTYEDSIYFQGIHRSSTIDHKIDNYTPAVVQTGDILAVNVKSLNSEGSDIFSTGSSGGSVAGATGSAAGGGGTSSGYLVDAKGEIHLPLIGEGVKVAGLTIPQTQDAIQNAIASFLKQPLVTVHITNFKITILGDVSHPDVFPISSESISIVQALSMAGDLTPSARRDNILLVREIDGQRKYINIDLTSDKLFDSPYYYLKNNDVLYVEAGRGKFVAVNPVKNNLPIVFSIISLALIVFEVSRKK